MKATLLSSLILVVFSALIPHVTFSQAKVEHTNSGDMIRDGIALHDKENYDGAIAKYDKVVPNDTNYVIALSEKSLSLLKLEKYDEAVDVCETALKNSRLVTPELYVNLSSALDYADKKEESLAVLDEGMKMFPKNNVLVFNKGVTLYNMKRYDEAVATFKDAIRLNPFHPGSHLMLGSIAADEGDYVKALLCLNTFLLLEPESDRAKKIIPYIDALASGNVSKKNAKGINLDDGDDFKSLESMVKNKSALRPKYEVDSKLDFNMIRQTQLILENLEYNPSGKGFWMQTYVKFYKELYDQKWFESFSYHLVLGSDNTEAQSTVKKNITKIKKFEDWAGTEWYNLHAKHEEVLNGKKQSVQYWYKGGESIDFVGNSSSKETFTPVGDALVYHDNGSLAGYGKYENGQRTGEWFFFDENGKKTEDDFYKDGKANGKAIGYYDNGNMRIDANYKDDLYEGEVKRYFLSGGISFVENYKAGKLDGVSMSYYANGQKESEISYRDGDPDGKIVEYYPDGSKSMEGTYVKGKKSGLFTEYYRNGKVKSQFTYTSGLYEGPFKQFYANGQVFEEGTAKAGIIIGERKEYYPDGSAKEIENSDESGKRNGLSKTFDYDGKLHYEWEYNKGEITAYRYYNKNEDIIEQGKRKLTKFPFTGYYPDGMKEFEGDYEGSIQNGMWKYYDRYGGPSVDDPYKDGNLEGTTTTYYRNGQIEKRIDWKGGVESGYFVSFYRNKQMSEQGWYVDGQLDGEWYSYTYEGKVSSHNYYIMGSQSGWQENYDDNGKIDTRSYYENDRLMKTVLYDTTGVVIDTIRLDVPETIYKQKDYNGRDYFEGHYKNGVANGDFTWKFPNGQVSTKGMYLNGDRDGDWTSYYRNGKVKSEAHYVSGDAWGEWKDYFDNGQLRQVRNFFEDDQTGAWVLYHPNGKEYIKGQFIEGERNGAFYYYDETGQLEIIKYFDSGKPIGYSYNGTDGKAVAMIPVKNGTAHVIGYYQNGKKSTEYDWKKGEIDGKFTEYYSNGTLQEEANYVNGDFSGSRKQYYSNGKISEDENYTFDELHGMQSYYYEDGTPKEILHYKYGTLQGEAKYYTTAGKAETIIYYDGVAAGMK